MIELTVLDYLQRNLAVEVHMEVPENPPDRFVVLKKAGGGREDLLYRSMFLVRSYGGTLLEAAELNEEAKKVLFGIRELPEIGGCYLTGDYNFTDTALKRNRYQAVFDIYHY